MKNVKITNMDNGVVIIISKEQFETCKTLLNENSVYEYTDLPITQIIMPKEYGKVPTLNYISKVLGGMPNEINRTTII